MEDKYLVLCLNARHPSGKQAYFLLEDDNDWPVIFDSEKDAKDWIAGDRSNLLLYALININDLEYQ